MGLDELGDRHFLVGKIRDRQRQDHRLVDVHRVVEERRDPVLVRHHIDDVGGAQARRGLSGVNAHPGRRAIGRRRVPVGKRHSLCGQFFKAGGLVEVALGVGTPRVHLHRASRPTLIVGENQDDVLPRSHGRCSKGDRERD
jgi:hypothetical protein